MSKFDNFLFRCSSLGKIWSTDGDLTQANKSHLLEIFIEHVHNVHKDIISRYFEKGKFMEEDAITMIKDALYPDYFLRKNTERKYNDYITGECDLLTPDEIIWDCKNAYEIFTFGKADLTRDYEEQGRGYMWLWGKKIFRLFYALNNTPEHLLAEEERRIYWKQGFVTMENPDYLALCDEMRKKHNYDHMKLWERFKIWEIEHNDDWIETTKKKIVRCRKYLNKLWGDHLLHLAKNKRLMGIPDVILAEHDTKVNATIISPIS